MGNAIETKVFDLPPSDFNPSVKVAGCFCEYQDQILLLKRHPKCPQGNTWGIPAGKINNDELPEKAVVRELLEETGLKIQKVKQIGVSYLRHPNADYIFYLFETILTHSPPLTLALDENIEAQWLNIEEAFKLPLIGGGKELLTFYQAFRLQKG